MDRNDLLAETRDHFLRSFTDALPTAIERSIEQLYKKAEVAYLSVEQHRFFDARAVLNTRAAQFKTLCVRNLEQLLNRGFQTAYSTFRQSGTVSFKATTLSLLEISAVDDDLHIANITDLFRDEADEELRDLNIRVALLFEQENIKERENPFRPYVLTRSISRSAEMLELKPDVAMALSDQLCQSLVPHVAAIYGGLNELLSRHGIAAQLKLKIRKSQERGPNTGSGAAPSEAEEAAEETRNAQDAVARAQAEVQARREAEAIAATEARVKSQRRVDRLIGWIRGASKAGGSQPSPTAVEDSLLSSLGPLQPGEMVRGPTTADSTTSNSESPPPTWLSSGERASDVLRRAFLTGIGSALPPRAAAAEFAGNSDGMAGDAGDASGDLGGDPGNNTGELPITTRLAHGRLTRSVQVMVHGETPAAADMFQSDGSIRNLILEQRTQLNELTDAEQERMTIDIVAMLFEFILRDVNVPAEVRAQLGRLQFLVLKTALREPSFFNHKSHPARMLVNRIGSISLSLKQVDPSGERLTAEICRIVEVLLADTDEHAELFATVLDEFDQFVARELRTSDEVVERAAIAMESVESRTLQFARITSMIADGLTVMKVESKLHHFIVHTWAHVVERAGRTDAGKSKHFRALVPDLIWSIAPKVVEVEKKRLLKMLPHILKTLKEGMTVLEWEPAKQEDFLSWLIDSHTYAMRAVNLVGVVPPLSYIQDHFKAFVDNASFDADTAIDSTLDSGSMKLEMGAAFSPALMADAIREMKLDIQVLDDLFDENLNLKPEEGATAFSPSPTLSPTPTPSPAAASTPLAQAHAETETGATATQTSAASDPASQTSTPVEIAPQPVALEVADEDVGVMSKLRSGITVEVSLHGRPSVATLNWISPNESTLILKMVDRTKPSIVTIKLFRWLLRTGRARFIEATPLFERAVTSLLESADQIDEHEEHKAF